MYRIARVGPALKKMGIETVVALPAGSEAGAQMLHNRGLKVRVLRWLRCPRSIRRIPDNVRSLACLAPGIQEVRSLSAEEDIQLIHANGVRNLPAIFAVSDGSDLRLVVHLNDISTPRMFTSMISPLVNKRAAAFIYAADAVRKWYQGCGLDSKVNSVICYPPIESTFASYSIDGEGGLTAEESEIRLCAIGNINPSKDYVRLIRATHLLRNQLSRPVRLDIYGQILGSQTPYLRRVRKLITTLGLQERVRLHGFKECIGDVLGNSDLLVHAARHEAAPTVVLEALSMGCPVVATAVGGTAELFEDGRNGRLVRGDGDAEEVAAAIREVVDELPKWRRRAQASAPEVRRRFSEAACAKRHRSAYQRALGWEGKAKPPTASGDGT